jgi:hypothetical protein
LRKAACGLGAAEMIEHRRHRRSHDQFLDRRDHRRVGVELDVPAARFDAVDSGLEARAAHRGIADAPGCEIDADAAKALLAHPVEIGFRRLVVDHGDAPRIIAACLHAEQRRRIVGAVDRGRDDHDALDMQRLVQRRHLLRRGRFWGVDAACEERKLCGIAVDVGVAVDRAFGNVEVHGRCRLRRLAERGSHGHRDSGCDGSKHEAASVQHEILP